MRSTIPVLIAALIAVACGSADTDPGQAGQNRAAEDATADCTVDNAGAEVEMRPRCPEAGEHVDLHFPDEDTRGIGWRLQTRVDDGWERAAMLRSDANGREPASDPPDETVSADAEHDVGIFGPGPDRVKLPPDLETGEYRIIDKSGLSTGRFSLRR